MIIESDLITACIKRERKAEFEMYRLTYGYLMGICYRYVNSREEAQELLNIGFLKILGNLEKYRLEVPFKSWIRKVMINCIIDEYRKEKRNSEHIEYVEEYYESGSFSDVNNALQKMNVEQIHALIVKLPPVSQKVFNLFAIDGYSHKEIAGMLNIAEGTSKWHLNFARNKLKEMISHIVSPIRVVA